MEKERLQLEKEKLQRTIDRIQEDMTTGGDIKHQQGELEKHLKKLHEIDDEIKEKVYGVI